MVVIKHDVWRADCIAAIGVNGKELQVIPLSCDEHVSYWYDTPQHASRPLQDAVTQWKREIGQ